MFVEVNGHLINTDELLIVLPVEYVHSVIKDATPQYRFIFKDNQELCIEMKSDEYNKLKQTLLEVIK